MILASMLGKNVKIIKPATNEAITEVVIQVRIEESSATKDCAYIVIEVYKTQTENQLY